jgi:hydrogenase maturation protease
MNGEILVAGVGNIFLGDDAFGVEVVQRLSRTALPDHLKVKDFGIRSYDLAYALMDDWDLVILVDAAPRGDRPGTVYTIEPQIPSATETSLNVDAHSMNPVSVLQLVGALGGKVGRTLLVGCEPATVDADEDGHIGLSAPVQAAIGEAIQVIRDLANSNRNAKAA